MTFCITLIHQQNVMISLIRTHGSQLLPFIVVILLEQLMDHIIPKNLTQYLWLLHVILFFCINLVTSVNWYALNNYIGNILISILHRIFFFKMCTLETHKLINHNLKHMIKKAEKSSCNILLHIQFIQNWWFINETNQISTSRLYVRIR